MRTAFCSILTLLLVACGSQTGDGADSGRSARSERRDPDALTRACLAAIGRAREVTGNRTSAMADVLRACGSVFAAAPCREAYVRAADHPGPGGLQPVVDACTEAYCPRLRAPKPALCRPEPIPAEARSAAWRALFRAMLVKDLGQANADRIDEAFAALVETPEQPPAGPLASEEPAVVRLSKEGTDVRIELEGPDGTQHHWIMPAGSTDEQVIALVQGDLPPPARRPVIMRPARDVPFLDTMVVGNAFRALGCPIVRTE